MAKDEQGLVLRWFNSVESSDLMKECEVYKPNRTKQKQNHMYIDIDIHIYSCMCMCVCEAECMSTIEPAISSLVSNIKDILLGKTDLTNADEAECKKLAAMELHGDQVRAVLVLSRFSKAKFGSYMLEVKFMQFFCKVASQFGEDKNKNKIGELKTIHLTSDRKGRQMHTTGMMDKMCALLHSTKMLRNVWDAEIKNVFAQGSIFPNPQGNVASQLSQAGRHLNARLDLSKIEDSMFTVTTLCHSFVLDWIGDVEVLLRLLQQVAPELQSETMSKLFSPDNKSIYLRLQDMTVFNRCVNGVNLLRTWSTLIEKVYVT